MKVYSCFVHKMAVFHRVRHQHNTPEHHNHVNKAVCLSVFSYKTFKVKKKKKKTLNMVTSKQLLDSLNYSSTRFTVLKPALEASLFFFLLLYVFSPDTCSFFYFELLGIRFIIQNPCGMQTFVHRYLYNASVKKKRPA